jgi:hypothetical protein
MSAQITGAAPSEIAAVTQVLEPATSAQLALVYIIGSGSLVTCTPQARVPSVTQSGIPYTLSWTGVTEPNPTFRLEEATDPNFSQSTVVQTDPATPLSKQFQKDVTTDTTFYYHVRANQCGGAPGPYSPTVSIVVQAQKPVTGRQGSAAVPFGSTASVNIPFFIKSPDGKQALGDVTFTASTDKPYLTVNPPSGTIPPGGTTVTVTANPSNLPPGASTGTLNVTSSSGASLANKSVSVSLVTPTTTGGKGLPPPNALVIPAVAHAPGARGPFQSDVRLMNGTAGAMSYQLTFTPSGKDGTKEGKSTTLSVDPGQTIALNDILRDFFGVGATSNPGDAGQGALEIRPLNSSSTQSYAASRTFTFNENGTYGQFVAATPFSSFATKVAIVPIGGAPPTGTPTLTMTQIAWSPKFRTNIGLVEGSGVAATGNINVYDARNNLVKTVPYNLPPAGHQQMSLASLGVTNLDDGRVDVTVESAAGAVTAYASVIDNITNDPLAVAPVQASRISATRYVLTGMAALGETTPPNNFHSDIRLFNGGSTDVTVNATFYPRAKGTPVAAAAPIVLPKGQVAAFDDVVTTLFNSKGLAGAIVLTTSAPSSLIASGRTYTFDSRGGTFGQFIPGASPNQGIGAGDRPMQILQLEESANFRSNVGVTELSGSPAKVRLTAFAPDSKVTPSTEIDLAANEFMQVGRILAGFFPGQSTYNARVNVEVISGTGRVAAYGSVIDNASFDPTYVPAQ